MLWKGDFFMKKKNSSKIALFGSVRNLTAAAMLTAMSVVIGIVCKNFLDFGNGLFRITFENFPIILSGIMFGPVVGGITGIATDLISYFLSHQTYAPNFIVMFGAMMVGVVSGVFSHYVFRKKGYLRLIIPSILAHVISSMTIKTIGLFSYYGWAVLVRIPLYIAIASFEIALICLIYRNPTIRKLIDGGVDNELR